MAFGVSSESLSDIRGNFQVFLDIMVTLNWPAGCVNELFMRDLYRYYTKKQFFIIHMKYIKYVIILILYTTDKS